jgi:hypothetical protein
MPRYQIYQQKEEGMGASYDFPHPTARPREKSHRKSPVIQGATGGVLL